MGNLAGPPFQRWLRGSSVQWLRKAAHVTSGVIVAATGAILATTPDKVWPPLEGTFQVWHDKAWLLLSVAAVLYLLAGVIPRGADTVALDAANAILNRIQAVLFRDVDDDEAHHRVTLFKRVRRWRVRKDASGTWQRPGRYWLEPIARSGRDTKETRVRFRSPDDPRKAEGVAGRAWARVMEVRVEHLPDLSSANCTADDLSRYAEDTFVPKKWVREEDPRCRSLMGFRVDDARSDPWGVLVIDSRLSSFNMQQAQAEFRSYTPVLAQLVQSL